MSTNTDVARTPRRMSSLCELRGLARPGLAHTNQDLADRMLTRLLPP